MEKRFIDRRSLRRGGSEILSSGAALILFMLSCVPDYSSS
jgi:hypothetical protein